MQQSASLSSVTSIASSTTYAHQSNISSSSNNLGVPSLVSSDSIRLVHQGADPNSPDTFKENIHLIRDHVERINILARTVLRNSQEAYTPGIFPYQAEADLETLKQSLQFLSDILRQSGVGALPLLSSSRSEHHGVDVAVPSEAQLIADTTNAVTAVYDRELDPYMTCRGGRRVAWTLGKPLVLRQRATEKA
ncbi:Mediator complex subunit 11 [Pleurotus pulmonarius]